MKMKWYVEGLFSFHWRDRLLQIFHKNHRMELDWRKVHAVFFWQLRKLINPNEVHKMVHEAFQRWNFHPSRFVTLVPLVQEIRLSKGLIHIYAYTHTWRRHHALPQSKYEKSYGKKNPLRGQMKLVPPHRLVSNKTFPNRCMLESVNKVRRCLNQTKSKNWILRTGASLEVIKSINKHPPY